MTFCTSKDLDNWPWALASMFLDAKEGADSLIPLEFPECEGTNPWVLGLSLVSWSLQIGLRSKCIQRC